MDLITLFMTLCLHTQLDCDAVQVDYVKFETGRLSMYSGPSGLPQTLGRATIYRSGGMRIEINEQMEPWAEWRRRDVIIHELAHLVVWTENPNRMIGDHGSTFRRACYNIAEKAGVPRKRCKGGH